MLIRGRCGALFVGCPFTYGPDHSQIFIGLGPSDPPEPYMMTTFRAAVSLTWCWLPRILRAETDGRLLIYGPSSYARFWTGREREVIAWWWPVHLSVGAAA